MSFQGYLNTIRQKTGLGPTEIKQLAADKNYLVNGKLRDGVKAGEIIAWLAEDYKLGRGHAMAIVALLRGTKKEGEGQ